MKGGIKFQGGTNCCGNHPNRTDIARRHFMCRNCKPTVSINQNNWSLLRFSLVAPVECIVTLSQWDKTIPRGKFTRMVNQAQILEKCIIPPLSRCGKNRGLSVTIMHSRSHKLDESIYFQQIPNVIESQCSYQFNKLDGSLTEYKLLEGEESRAVRRRNNRVTLHARLKQTVNSKKKNSSTLWKRARTLPAFDMPFGRLRLVCRTQTSSSIWRVRSRSKTSSRHSPEPFELGLRGGGLYCIKQYQLRWRRLSAVRDYLLRFYRIFYYWNWDLTSNCACNVSWQCWTIQLSFYSFFVEILFFVDPIAVFVYYLLCLILLFLFWTIVNV